MIARHLHDAWQTGKRTLGHAWHHAVRFAGDVDRGMGMAKKIFGVLHPMIENLGGSRLNAGAMNAFSAFDSSKADVMYGHNQVQAIQNRLRRAVPEIGI